MDSTLSSIFITLAIISCLLVIPVLVLQIQARNIAVSVLLAAALLFNLLHAVNAFIWPWAELSSDAWRGYGLCDVEVKLFVGINMLVPGGIACLFRQLSIILNPKLEIIHPSQHRTRTTILFETTSLAILPTLRTIFSYAVQPDRYGIQGVSGCTATVDTSWPSYALVLVWPFIMSIVSLLYGALATWRMHKHYREMQRLLSESQIPARRARLRRMYVFATAAFLVDTPSRVALLVSNIPHNLQPYLWSHVHPPNWSQKISMIPTEPYLIVVQAASVVWSILAFLILGSGNECKAVYRVWFDRLWTQLSGRWIYSKNASMRASGSQLQSGTSRHG